MSRYIDAEWLKEHIEVISYEGMWHTTETDEFVAVDNINQAPSIDIVRCGECKMWMSEHLCQWWSRYGTVETDADDFCSYGVNSSEKPNNSTISKMEQVETMSCAECKHRPIGAEICEEPCHYEPQTDWHYDEQDATWYPYKHEDEPQQKSCATCKHALGNWDGESNNCGRCCGADRRFYEPKDEQTERNE